MRLFRPLFRPTGLAWLGIVLVGSLLLLAAPARWHRPDPAPARPSAEAVAASRQPGIHSVNPIIKSEALRRSRRRLEAERPRGRPVGALGGGRGRCDMVLAAEPLADAGAQAALV